MKTHRLRKLFALVFFILMISGFVGYQMQLWDPMRLLLGDKENNKAESTVDSISIQQTEIEEDAFDSRSKDSEQMKEVPILLPSSKSLTISTPVIKDTTDKIEDSIDIKAILPSSKVVILNDLLKRDSIQGDTL